MKNHIIYFIFWLKLVVAFVPCIINNKFNTKLYCIQNDLIVFGASTRGIGARVIKTHREKYPNATIIGVTQTTKNHELLTKLNCIPAIYDNISLNSLYSNVVLTVPPNSSYTYEQNEKYKSIVNKSLSVWNKKGKFIFSSSGGVYVENKGGIVNENSIINKNHTLYQCEKVIRQNGGTILRFGALYGINRGDFWRLLDMDAINISKNIIIEMCNYDDAASAISLILYTNISNIKGEIYNVCDGKGKTLKEILINCKRVYEYKDKKIPNMTNDTYYLGKKYNITKIKQLGWRLRWNSFEEWCRAYSYALNTNTNEIKIYEKRKYNEKEEKEKQYDMKLKNENNIFKETIMVSLQFAVFVIVELYLKNIFFKK